MLHAPSAQAVSTASLIPPPQSVPINELSQLLRECADAMMLFLIRDVPRYLIDI